MEVGNSHYWNYKNGKWNETKEAPDRWSFTFNSIKTRVNPAPINTGAYINTKFHWFILADQIASKINNNSYMTSMKGIKYKIGHKRPQWRSFSYNYPQQLSYKERVINILEDMIKNIKNGNYNTIDISKFEEKSKPIIL
jgi:hypothetical protein